MSKVWIEGVGLRAPGLNGWDASRAILRGEQQLPADAPLELPAIASLPANERRRLVPAVRLALVVGLEAFEHARRAPAETPTIFAASGGDGETIDNIMMTLAANEFEVSPTRFHNSVHNAPAGYWGIATRSRAPSSSLCAHDASFAAGLIEAVAQCLVDHTAVGLVADDLPYPGPLHAKRPIGSAFGVALVLTDAPTANTRASIEVSIDRAFSVPTAMADPALEVLRRGNPAARSLPLLAALACGEDRTVSLDYTSDRTLTVAIADSM